MKTFANRYNLVQLLGRGNFSEVWKAKDIMTDVDVAIKIYAPSTGLDDHGLNVFAREFAIVVNANHKNLLTPLHYDTCDRKPYLVLPYCKKGSAEKLIGTLDEKEAWKFLRDVASGLAFLHEMETPVIHQDIKPDNILVSKHGDYMLTDFGVSSHCRNVLRKSLSQAFSSAGTTAYMAPERFGKRSSTPIMASDIYSLGATAFELLTGDAPFGNEGGLRQLHESEEIPELPAEYSKDLRKVIKKCISTEPWERPTAAQLQKYAEMGLAGKKVKFDDEAKATRKYWYAFFLLLVAIIAVCAYLAYGRQSSESEQPEAPAPTEVQVAQTADS